MRLGSDYELIFSAEKDIDKVVAEIIKSRDIKKFETKEGFLYVGLKKGKAIGAMIVEKDKEKEDTYIARLIHHNGKINDFVIFLGEKRRIPLSDLL